MVTPTPFGSPVEPDVNITYAGDSPCVRAGGGSGRVSPMSQGHCPAEIRSMAPNGFELVAPAVTRSDGRTLSRIRSVRADGFRGSMNT